MSFTLNCRARIGQYSFRGGLNDVQIRKGVNALMDTGQIRLPALSRVVGDELEKPQSSVETARLFREGDPVTIELGYNGQLKKEFEGFVRRVNIGTPLTLELEGYGWQLRQKNIRKSWKATTLLEVLREVVRDTDITLSRNIPGVKLEKFYLQNVTGLEALEHLKDKLHLTVYFSGKELYAGILQGEERGEATYRLGWNVIRDNGLKYRLAESTRVQVVVKRKLQKGKEQVVYRTGDPDGSVHEIKLPNVTQKVDVQKIGEQALKTAKYTGYEGKITAFLQPYCEPGYKAIVDDVRYGERSGAFFVVSTEVTFGMRGARRIVEISYRMDG